MSMETTDLPPGGFCGGEPHYRAARQRAAIACRKYNMLPEDCAPERRTNAWLEIVRPTIAKATRTMFDPNAVGAGPATSLATPPGTPRRSVDLSSGLSPSKMPVAEGKGKLSALDQLNPIDRLDSLPHSALPPTQITPSSSNDGLPESDAIYKLTSQRRHVNLYPGYGQAPYIKGPVYVDYGINLHIANSTFINRGCMILDTPHSEIRIGEKCSIGPGVHFYGVTHPLDPHHRMDPKYPASSIAADIRVGDMCWIGGGAKILGGVTIGEGAVIGAGSVVTKSVPPYTVAYGVPARIRRSIPRTPCRVDCKLDHQCVGSVSALDPRIPTRWHSVREFHRHWMRYNPGTIVAILLGMNSVSLAGVIWLSLRHIT